MLFEHTLDRRQRQARTDRDAGHQVVGPHATWPPLIGASLPALLDPWRDRVDPVADHRVAVFVLLVLPILEVGAAEAIGELGYQAGALDEVRELGRRAQDPVGSRLSRAGEVVVVPLDPAAGGAGLRRTTRCALRRTASASSSGS